MKNEWRKCNTGTLGGYSCIEHRVNQELPENPVKHEKCIASKRGQIWELNDGSYGVVVFTGKTAKKVAEKLQARYNSGKLGDEHIFFFNSDKLATIIDILKPPKSLKTMARYAEEI